MVVANAHVSGEMEEFGRGSVDGWTGWCCVVVGMVGFLLFLPLLFIGGWPKKVFLLLFILHI